MIWYAWLFIGITFFIVAMLWIPTTVFFAEFSDTSSVAGNFQDTAINTSFQRTVTRVNTMWNLWPLAALLVGFIVLFYLSSDEDEEVRIRGGF